MSDMFSIQNISETEKSLMAISAECADRLKLAENLACTEETKQTAKKLRSELNKEFSEYEAERKAKTAEYEKPLKQFKELYDRYITKPFKNADTALKIKISEVEDVQREEKTLEVKEYANELKQVYALDWLETDRVMPNITLSASEKALKKEVKETLERIKSEVDCIHAISENSELMAQYMECLDLPAAQTIIAMRKQHKEQAEQAMAIYKQQEEVKQKVVERIEQLAPPVIEEEKPEEKKYTMTFTVSGTIEQLKALKTFMIENNITFSNGGNGNDTL